MRERTMMVTTFLPGKSMNKKEADLQKLTMGCACPCHSMKRVVARKVVSNFKYCCADCSEDNCPIAADFQKRLSSG